VSDSLPSTNPGSDDILRVIGRSWGWVLFFGIATVILGILVVLRPEATIYGFAILLGIWLFVSGLFRLVLAIADDHDSGATRVMLAILGILSVIVGIFFLRHTYETITSLAFLIGLFWVVGGIIEFFSAYSHPDTPGRGIRIGMGLLGLIAGVVTLVVPGITLVTLATIMGVWLVIYGLLQIVTALTLRALFAPKD
jgi:uncharacterized membrane protein HdeD (DUF308 family)